MNSTTLPPIDSNRVDFPTPLEVLALDAPRTSAPEFEPSAEDWREYDRWREFHERVEAIHAAETEASGLTDADLIASGLPVG